MIQISIVASPVSPAISILAERTKVRSSTGGELSAAPRGGEALPSCFGLFALGIYMSVLLDGHHRACACALEEKQCRP